MYSVKNCKHFLWDFVNSLISKTFTQNRNDYIEQIFKLFSLGLATRETILVKNVLLFFSWRYVDLGMGIFRSFHIVPQQSQIVFLFGRSQGQPLCEQAWILAPPNRRSCCKLYGGSISSLPKLSVKSASWFLNRMTQLNSDSPLVMFWTRRKFMFSSP